MANGYEELKELILDVKKHMDGRFDNLEKEIADIKEDLRVTKGEVAILREDMTTVNATVGDIKEEQVYPSDKWGEHDRKISKIERKAL
ncbi:hypothetical protein SAMN04488123_12526 [Natribacillus halophilus]|uniref:Uncharacterized protein n=2 Tax=Natribacillus halophilus TaxID=549003 RepID=A0A1G8SDU7_9BACI|nr:hypothetical protein SAMN04488123_12526 [Natribacillus halophilus]